MICTNCDEENDFLIQLPVKVISKDGSNYERVGYHSDGKPSSICFNCLQFEAEEVL